MATSKDIARELNLSQSTVSRILNGERGYRVADETRRRVWETARRLQYQPNAVARSLRRGRTHTIGIHTSRHYDVRNEFLGTIVGALQQACADRHLDILLHSGDDDASAEQMFGKLRDGRVDGLILRSHGNEALVTLLGQSSLPVVAVADILPHMPSIVCDDRAGMRQMMAHLWDRGHRRYVFLAPEVDLPSVENRVEVFTQELTLRGVPAADRKIRRMDFECSAQLLGELREMAPIAVCCWNDRTAYNLLEAALAARVQIPEEMAITGFDGLRNTQLMARLLTTIRCPWEDVATRSLEVLVGLIENRPKDSDPASPLGRPAAEVFPTVLIPGNTS